MSYGRGVCAAGTLQGREGVETEEIPEGKKSICQFGELGTSEGLPRTCKEVCSARYS